jgi:hypothetical protein
VAGYSATPLAKKLGIKPGARVAALNEALASQLARSALPMGLVDIKICAVDDTWTGLKLVIRKENRRKD